MKRGDKGSGEALRGNFRWKGTDGNVTVKKLVPIDRGIDFFIRSRRIIPSTAAILVQL